MVTIITKWKFKINREQVLRIRKRKITRIKCKKLSQISNKIILGLFLKEYESKLINYYLL
jgi:hypothetical protein